jgi:hypothetical protein
VNLSARCGYVYVCTGMCLYMYTLNLYVVCVVHTHACRYGGYRVCTLFYFFIYGGTGV